MAKKATSSAGKRKGSSGSKAVAVRRTSSGGGRGNKSAADTASEAFIKLLQSPLVAELVAVAATAALTALAQEGIGGSRRARTGNAVKRAGKAAAKAIGDRLSTEIDEIKKAATAKRGAKA